MTDQLERSSIEAYFVAQWAAATPVGIDDHEFTPVNNSVRLTIENGDVLQGSIGREANRIDHVGVVMIQVFTEGGKGSAAARGYTETIKNIFFEKTLDNAGAVITSVDDAFIRFSPRGELHPYIMGKITDTPFNITTVAAPFIRYEFK